MRKAPAGSLAVVCAGVVAALPGGALAQSQWITQVEMPVEAVRDSNPNMAVAQHVPVTRLRSSPELRTSYKGSRDEVDLVAALTVERSSNPDVSAERRDPRLRAELRHMQPRSTYSLLALYEQSAYRNVSIVEAVPLGVDGTRRLAAVAGSASHEISEGSAISADLRHDGIRYSTAGQVDNALTSANARYTRTLSELASWYAVATAQIYRPRGAAAGPATPSSRSEGWMLGYRRSMSDALAYDASAGSSRITGQTSQSSWQGSLRLTYTTAHAEYALEGARRSSGVGSLSGLGYINVLKVSASAPLGASTSLTAGIERSMLQTELSTRALNASLALVHQLSDRLQASIRAERRWREDVTGRAQAAMLSAALIYSIPDI